MRHHSWSLLLAAGLTACGGEASLLPDRSEYLPGQQVELRLRNGALEGLQHGPLGCARLEAGEGAGWVQVPQEHACAAVLLHLAGLSETSATFTLPAPLPPGTYRLSTAVEWEGARERVHSPGFEVRTAATP